ncbi:xanthine dehydrogenase family protein subunit M [bacterium]|nr:xanthine dehydrogenase family protein subunit M [bacterium]
MRLPKFDYLSPTSLTEALEIMGGYKNRRLKLLGGGTDLLVDLRDKVILDVHNPHNQEHRCHIKPVQSAFNEPPEYLLSLSRIADLRGIRSEGNKIIIGAMTTITDLERSDIVKKKLSGLHDGAWQLGSPLVRNRGTYGGNLCNARPAADTAIPTMALGGKLVLISKRGERTVEHDDFVLGPGNTIIMPDEILKEIIFDLPDVQYGSAYIKLANRKALEISVVGAAASVIIKDGIVISARITLGAVAPKPLLVPEAGQLLLDRELTDDNIEKAAKTASKKAKPITDHRGGATYRTSMVEVLTKRALMICRARALNAERMEASS